MAIGARQRDILTQFLLEAVMISFAGCLLGLLIGLGVALAINAFTGMVVVISAPPPCSHLRSLPASGSFLAGIRRARPRNSTRSKRFGTNDL